MNVPELVNNDSIRSYMTKLAKKLGLKFGKNDTSLKLKASSRKVELAVDRLHELMKISNEKLLRKIIKCYE